MQWKDVGKAVGKFAPLLGDLLPIPGAGVAGRLISAALGVDNTPDAIHAAIQSDPDAAIKLAAIEADNKALLQKQLLAAESMRIQSVNQTMQAESASEHWAQWMWRPFNGFLFGTTLFLVYALPTILNSFMPVFLKTTVWVPVEIAHVPEFVFMAWGGVLGVTAWHRGASKAAGKS